MSTLTIGVSKEDIDAAQGYHLPPLLFVLVRRTGSLWRISDCGTALELVAPFRTFTLPPEAQLWWRQYNLTGAIEPHHFTVSWRTLQSALKTQEPALRLLPDQLMGNALIDTSREAA